MTLIQSLKGHIATLKPAKRAATAPDAFELRLQRIGSREARVPLRPVLFKNRPAPLGA